MNEIGRNVIRRRINVIFSRKVGWGVLIGLFFGAMGCTEPCLELTTRLCKCEATEAAQQTCAQTKTSEASDRETTVKEQEQCEAYLDKAECQESTICEENNKMVCGISSPNSQGSQ